jgi:hypothetical protein
LYHYTDLFLKADGNRHFSDYKHSNIHSLKAGLSDKSKQAMYVLTFVKLGHIMFFYIHNILTGRRIKWIIITKNL